MNINGFSSSINMTNRSNVFSRESSGTRNVLAQFADKAKARAGEVDTSTKTGFIDDTDDSRRIRFMLAVATVLERLTARIDIYTNSVDVFRARAENEIASYESILSHIKGSTGENTVLFRPDTIMIHINPFEPWQAEQFDSYAYVGMSQQKREQLIHHIIASSRSHQDTSNSGRGISLANLASGVRRELGGPFCFELGFRQRFTIPEMKEFDSDDMVSNEIQFWQSVIEETRRIVHDAKDFVADRLNLFIGYAVFQIMGHAKRYLEDIEISMDDIRKLFGHFTDGNRSELDLSWFIMQNKFAGAIVGAINELRVSGATFFEDISNIRSSINSIARNKLGSSLNMSRFQAFA